MSLNKDARGEKCIFVSKFINFWRARSRLYRSRILRGNVHFEAFSTSTSARSRLYRNRILRGNVYFEAFSTSTRRKKEVRTLFFSRKKEHLAERRTLKSQHRIGRLRQTRRPVVRLWRPWGLFTLYVGSRFGLRWVYVRSTFGLRWVISKEANE